LALVIGLRGRGALELANRLIEHRRASGSRMGASALRPCHAVPGGW
jgi:hypothetical protein